jgi:hypothetical protein
VSLRWYFTALLLASPFVVLAQPSCRAAHVTVFDSNVAEFLEERTLDLRTGSNPIDWRSLMPQSYIRTIRIAADPDVTVVREEVTLDGPEVHNQKSPVLHMTLQNSGASGLRKVRVDYLAPGLSWKSDYSLALGASTADNVRNAQMDGWVTM